MKKIVKWTLALILTGTAIGLIIAYFTRSREESEFNYDFDFDEDEDFDLDEDLQPMERSYVSLTKPDSEGTDEDKEASAS